jgi:hypothetical protein
MYVVNYRMMRLERSRVIVDAKKIWQCIQCPARTGPPRFCLHG